MAYDTQVYKHGPPGVSGRREKIEGKITMYQYGSFCMSVHVVAQKNFKIEQVLVVAR
jgi:hypothetical protein